MPATQTPDHEQIIADLRALLKAKDEEIADLTRDRNRLEGRILFANAGSALRAPTPSNLRCFPCPTCGEDDCLTCADRAEGRGGYE